MKYYVISLERTPQRLKHFYSMNRGRHRIDWFEAFDGRVLEFSQLEDKGLIQRNFRKYSLGAIGCALSHRTLWEYAISSGEPVTVIEDDAILNHRFFTVLEEMTERLQGRYDLIQWGWNFDSILSFHLPGNVSRCTGFFNQDQLRQEAATFQSLDARHELYKLHSSFGTMAYTISPGGAARFRRACFPLVEKNIPFDGVQQWSVPNYGIDIVMNEVYRADRAQCYVCFPPLAASKNEHDASTIRGPT